MLTFGLIGAISPCRGGRAVDHAKEEHFGSRRHDQEGDTLLFVNDDSVTHNIMSTSPKRVQSGAMAPGVSTPITFNDEGQIMVICAIHPRMKMTVNVTK